MTATIFCRMIGIVLIVLAPIATHAQSLKVTLLGTNGPQPVIDRFGPSTLIEAGTEKLLFDCGRGASQRLWQLKIPLGDVNNLFLTHLHSDHVVGIPDLWLHGRLSGPYGGRKVPFRVWGPTGTKEMMSYLEKAYEFDIRIRVRNPKPGFHAEDIDEGVVYEKNGVKVTAFAVDHGTTKPAFGYRIDYAGRSVVISGDTTLSENLIRFSQGADVLVHEVAAYDPELLRTDEAVRRRSGGHTTPEQAGEVFARVKPKLAVYYHIDFQRATVKDLIDRTRKTYSGPLEVGEDLMVIEVGEKVEVRRFVSPSR